MSKPLPLGTLFDGHRIIEVVEHDPDDDCQPYLYRLDNSETVWIDDPEAEETRYVIGPNWSEN